MNQLTNLQLALIICGTLICYYLYYYISVSATLKRIVYSKKSTWTCKMAHFLAKKAMGFFILGIIPFTLYLLLIDKNLIDFGCNIQSFVSNFKLILVLSLIILLILFINQKLNSGNNSLQIKITQWNLSSFLFNAFGWTIYLIAYEFLFRGILLYACYEELGFWTAIAINISIYSAIHMVHGKQQAIGALFFGFIACYFTLKMQTLLIPIFMHLTLSLGSDFFSLRFNPELRFSFSFSSKN